MTNDTKFVELAGRIIPDCLNARTIGDELPPEDRVFIYTCIRELIKVECFKRRSLEVVRQDLDDVFNHAAMLANALPDWWHSSQSR